jgi:hypothetical protein
MSLQQATGWTCWTHVRGSICLCVVISIPAPVHLGLFPAGVQGHLAWLRGTEREAYHYFPYTAEMKNTWRFISSPVHTFVVWFVGTTADVNNNNNNNNGDSAVAVVREIRTGLTVRFEARSLIFSHRVQAVSRAPSFYPVVDVRPFLETWVSGAWSWRPSVAEVKNARRYILTSPCVFMATALWSTGVFFVAGTTFRCPIIIGVIIFIVPITFWVDHNGPSKSRGILKVWWWSMQLLQLCSPQREEEMNRCTFCMYWSQGRPVPEGWETFCMTSQWTRCCLSCVNSEWCMAFYRNDRKLTQGVIRIAIVWA